MTQPLLILDIDGVLQAPSMKYGHEQTRVIREHIATADVHPSMWPRKWHGYGAERRRRDHVTFNTQVRVSPKLLEDLTTLPVDVVMLTTWLEHDSVRRFLDQATDGRSWFPDATLLTFPRRDHDGAVPSTWKLDELRRLIAATRRPFIWIDDDEVPAWREVVAAENTDLPHLLIAPDSNRGITPDHVDAIRGFIATLN